MMYYTYVIPIARSPHGLWISCTALTAGIQRNTYCLHTLWRKNPQLNVLACRTPRRVDPAGLNHKMLRTAVSAGTTHGNIQVATQRLVGAATATAPIDDSDSRSALARLVAVTSGSPNGLKSKCRGWVQEICLIKSGITTTPMVQRILGLHRRARDSSAR